MARSSWLPSIWGEHREGEEPFHAMRKQLDVLFDDWARGMHLPSVFAGEGVHAPRIEVSETPTDTCITVELPGVDQKDIEVLLNGRQLTLKGEKKSEFEDNKEENGRILHRTERSYGAFQRIIELPYDADPKTVSAAFKDGVLMVTVPKPAEIKAQTKKIEVKRPS
jgi:HSP20 family protein